MVVLGCLQSSAGVRGKKALDAERIYASMRDQ